MPGDTVKVVYAVLDDLARHLTDGAGALEEIKANVVKYADVMRQGAFVGQAGDHLTSSLTGQFAKSIDRLAEYYRHMAKAVGQAADDMRHADQHAASKF